MATLASSNDALAPGQPGSWTIYTAEGDAALEFDTFIGCSVKSEDKIAQNPIERGGFVDYNRVATPTTVGVILGKTGTTDALSKFIEQLDKFANSTDLLSIVTPEKTFVDYSLASYDYNRTAENGTDRIVVNLVLEEIRQVDPEYSQEKLPKKKGDSGEKKTGKKTGDDADDDTQGRVQKESILQQTVAWLKGGGDAQKEPVK